MKQGSLLEIKALEGENNLGWLTRRSLKSRVVHIWNGIDTACHLYSTGGLRRDKYIAVPERGDRDVCIMCLNNAAKERAP